MEQVILTGTIKLDAKAISPLRFGLLIADEYITCYNYAPFEVLEDQKTAVAEYLIRANHGVVLGNFEMNYGTGQLYYKTTLMHHNLLRNDAAAFESVERLMTLGTNMWQRYGESMASLAAGFVSGDSVKELVKQIDGTE